MKVMGITNVFKDIFTGIKFFFLLRMILLRGKKTRLKKKQKEGDEYEKQIFFQNYFYFIFLVFSSLTRANKMNIVKAKYRTKNRIK